jgi:ParB family chromosome partitioning protein
LAPKVRGRDPLAALFRLQAAEPSIAEYAAAKLIPIDLLDENPHQPRLSMDPEALQDLSDSIAARGVLQPLVVRRRGERFQVIAGHRRRAAARMAGLEEVPCIVLEISDDDLLEIALIENLLRENLDPLDEARAFVQLRERYGYSLRDIARRINKHHEYVAMRLRLLTHPEISDAVQQGMKPTVAERIARISDPELRNGLLDRAARGERIKIKDIPTVPRRGRRSDDAAEEDEDGPHPTVLRPAALSGRRAWGEESRSSQERGGGEVRPPETLTAYIKVLQELAARLQVLEPQALSPAEAREAVAYLMTVKEYAERHLQRLQPSRPGGRAGR